MQYVEIVDVKKFKIKYLQIFNLGSFRSKIGFISRANADDDEENFFKKNNDMIICGFVILGLD